MIFRWKPPQKATKYLPRRAVECYRLRAPTHLVFWKDPCGIAPVLGLHSVKVVSVCVCVLVLVVVVIAGDGGWGVKYAFKGIFVLAP